jgi:hypothetical protein
MKFSVKSMKTLLASHGKNEINGWFKNGDRFYAVTGWSGEYTIKGITWQLGLV